MIRVWGGRNDGMLIPIKESAIKEFPGSRTVF
jgi:hypothetical protein